MGTWNTKPFGNDKASDWLWELEQAKDDSVIKAAFEADADADETVAAAAVVAAARRQPIGALPPKAKAWVGVIGWALGLEDRIFPYDSQLDSTSFVYRWQILSPTKQFVSSAHLRAEKEILQAREVAESWLWRARTTQIQKEPEKYPPPPGWTYERIIAMAAEHWEKEGLFQAIRGEYPAHGKAYCELADEEWQEVRSMATERLYGLNWLCKYSANWDLVPTGT